MINNVSRHYVAALYPDGSLDTSFNPGLGPNGALVALAVQADEKVLIGGFFTTVNGVSRNYIARLNPDGTLDTSFAVGTGASAKVSAIALQADGRILVGGDFASFNGTAANRLVRLNSNGAVDGTFNVGTGADNTVQAIVVQSDRKILLGGVFGKYNNTARAFVARVDENGVLDAGFTPGPGPNGWLNSIALQLDGKVLVGGIFDNFSGSPRGRVARLNTNGTLDTSFTTGTNGANNWINSVAVQPDGRVIIGGLFTSYNGNSANYLARLNTDGSFDGSFNLGSGYTAAVQWVEAPPDGSVVVGSTGPTLNGTAVNRIARLVGLIGSPHPELEVEQNGGNLALTWPVYTGDWRLRETSDLGVFFVDSQTAVGATNNGIATVSIPLGTGRRFHRLERALP